MVYFNEAIEPTLDPARLVQFHVFDDRYASNITGFVNISLVNDNNLTLDCGAGLFSFTEGSNTPVFLAGLLSLSDLDTDHTVSEASVEITNAQLGDEIAVSSSLSSFIRIQQSNNGARVDLSGEAMVTEYQVWIASYSPSFEHSYFMDIFFCLKFQNVLRSLTFINRESEPSMVQRSIHVTVNSPGDSQSCRILVSLLFVNDNPPIVDLSGPLQPSINHTASLNYNFMSQASVPIASQDATITDLDADGRIESLEANLTAGFPNDGIFLSETSGCPIDNSSTCHLRLVT